MCITEYILWAIDVALFFQNKVQNYWSYSFEGLQEYFFTNLHFGAVFGSRIDPFLLSTGRPPGVLRCPLLCYYWYQPQGLAPGHPDWKTFPDLTARQTGFLTFRPISTQFQDLDQRHKGAGRAKYPYISRLASIGLLFAGLGFFVEATHIPLAAAFQIARAEPQNSQTIDFLEAATNVDPRGAMGGGDITILDSTALSPDVGPAGTIADIQANDYQGAISVYVVRTGDTLPQIAKMFQVSLSTILSANKLASGATVHEGDTLVILPVDGVLHTVKKGDTLQGIAKRYGARVSDILDFNDLVAGQVLVAGDNIMVPNGKEGAAPSSGSSSAPSSRARLVASFPAISGYFTNPLPTGHKTQGIHGYNGIDIGAPKGSSVYAAADGVVVTSHFRPLDDPWFGGYGNYVDINHPNGTQTRYAHLSAVYVAVGAHVSQGQPIGEVGSTGHSTGPHLHFEVHGAKNPF